MYIFDAETIESCSTSGFDKRLFGDRKETVKALLYDK